MMFLRPVTVSGLSAAVARGRALPARRLPSPPPPPEAEAILIQRKTDFGRCPAGSPLSAPASERARTKHEGGECPL